jgi:hypothetical protein
MIPTMGIQYISLLCINQLLLLAKDTAITHLLFGQLAVVGAPIAAILDAVGGAQFEKLVASAANRGVSGFSRCHENVIDQGV